MDYTHSDTDAMRVYHMRGRFSHTDNERFTAILDDIREGPGRTIRMDLSNLEYLDSFGIGLFLVARDEARRASNRLEFGEPKGGVRKLFELAGLTSLLSPDRPKTEGMRRAPETLVAGGPGHRFRVSETQLDDKGTCHLALAGRFTFADHDGFQHVIDAIGTAPGRRWEIDLNDLDFMDSAALSMLLIARDQARSHGVEIVLKNPRGRVRQLFSLADIPNMMAVLDTAES